MIYPLVRELAVDGIPVTVTCRVLKIARAPYYWWLQCLVSEADWVAAHRANALFNAHRDDPEFGYRLLADEANDAGASGWTWPTVSATRPLKIQMKICFCYVRSRDRRDRSAPSS